MKASRKKHAEKVFIKLGINHSEAINLFYAQVELLKGLPFDIHIPNEKTEKILRDSKKGKNVKGFETKEEFYKYLGM